MVNRERVQALMEEIKVATLIRHKYKDQVDGRDCYCAVGCALKVAGEDVEIHHNMASIGAGDLIDERILLQEFYGFDEMTLVKLQRANDRANDHSAGYDVWDRETARNNALAVLEEILQQGDQV